MTTIIARAAESVHWYRAEDGAPQYTVKAKDGSDRPTTLRDARKLNLVPSVTTVLKVAAKPGLEVWKNEQMLLAALTNTRKPEETEKDFIARIVFDSKETAKAAAERGTRIHESIESWFNGERNVEHSKIAEAFEIQVNDHFKTEGKWITEHAFASPLGYGGKIDLFYGNDETHPYGIVVDAKTKEFSPGDDIAAYDEHLLQLAAYRHGLGLHHARCANVFASSIHHGLIQIIEWSEEDLVRGWEMFKHLLEYWKLKNNFGEDNVK